MSTTPPSGEFEYFDFLSSGLASGCCGLAFAENEQAPLRVGTTGSDYVDEVISRCLQHAGLRADLRYLCGKGRDVDSPVFAFRAFCRASTLFLKEHTSAAIQASTQRVVGSFQVAGAVAVVVYESKVLATLAMIQTLGKPFAQAPHFSPISRVLVSSEIPSAEETLVRIPKPQIEARVPIKIEPLPAALTFPFVDDIARSVELASHLYFHPQGASPAENFAATAVAAFSALRNWSKGLGMLHS